MQSTVESMNVIRSIFIIAIQLTWLTNTLHALPRTCRIVFPERPQDAPKVAYLFTGSKSLSVTLPSMNFSEVIELPNGEITIAMTPHEISDPKLLPPGAPLLKIPETVKDFYIIIVPDNKNPLVPVKMNLVNAGEEKFNPGETLWYNFTENRIFAKLGSNDMSVAPNSRVITKSPVSENSYYTARFANQVLGKADIEPITEQSWWHDTKSRHLGFIVNSGGKLPKIYFFRDFRDPETATKEVK